MFVGDAVVTDIRKLVQLRAFSRRAEYEVSATETWDATYRGSQLSMFSVARRINNT